LQDLSLKMNATLVEFPIEPIMNDGRRVPPNELEVIVTGPNGSPKGVMRLDVQPPRVSFTAPIEGAYKIEVKHNGVAIARTPITVNVKPKKDESEKPVVPNMPEMVKTPVRFEIPAIDENGDIIEGHEDVSINISGPEVVETKCSRQGDKFLIQFDTYRRDGTFNVSIMHKGKHIQRSPVDVNLQPKKGEPNQGGARQVPEVAQLPPVEKIKNIQFSIPAVLESGAPVKAHRVEAKCLDGPETPRSIKVSDKDDKTLAVAFEIGKPGTYILSLTVGDESIENSPFDVPVPESAFK